MILSVSLLLLPLLLGADAFFGSSDCDIKKEDSRTCALEKCDFSRDGKLEAAEVQFVFERILTGVSRWAALRFTSPTQAIDHCGDARTGYITHDSFMNSTVCIHACFERRMFKKLVCDVVRTSDDYAAEYASFAADFYRKHAEQKPVTGFAGQTDPPAHRQALETFPNDFK